MNIPIEIAPFCWGIMFLVYSGVDNFHWKITPATKKKKALAPDGVEFLYRKKPWTWSYSWCFLGSLETAICIYVYINIYIYIVALEAEKSITLVYVYNPAWEKKLKTSTHTHIQYSAMFSKDSCCDSLFVRWKIAFLALRVWSIDCEGVEFKGSRCELWTRKILASKNLSISAEKLVTRWRFEGTQWVIT